MICGLIVSPEKTIGTAGCEVDRIESVKCEREGVRKHSFFVCKIVCWKSVSEEYVLCWNFQHRLRKCVGNS